MFLMFATGTQLLLPNNSAIEKVLASLIIFGSIICLQYTKPIYGQWYIRWYIMTFIEKYNERVVDHGRGDPQQNPLSWPDFISPVKGHTCFNGVELPLLDVINLLEQPIPDDTTISTDFDLYQYIIVWRNYLNLGTGVY
ncbi:hypothetical protein GGX14DRAFT_407851 [Mycena pura]|uniref:Uncharacterized protein n=1 Tax=Mycena pura TaxID=153505 RepID=A0AAD6UQE6_9AGAR|nr:hypothetical protein GGX14DRAFT_407851 [Mycena pura]